MDPILFRYSVEIMGNGLTSVICRKSKSRGAYVTATAAYRHGDLRLDAGLVRRLIAARAALLN